MKKPVLIVITGPTASGKSALAVSLAQILKTEIISADSRQIYKNIPIVTAAPTEEEKKDIPHHLLEVLPLDAYYSAAKFEEDTKFILNDIYKKKDIAILCGGSMLYIDALIKGIDELPTVPKDIRDSLTIEWGKKGNQWLLSKLEKIDPFYFKIVDKNNFKRIFHAIEVSMTANVPYSSLLSLEANRKKELPFDVIKICLSGDREKLFQRINSRVETMMKLGLKEEARRVYPIRHLNSLNTVGLKEMFLMFDGILTEKEAISRIQKNTRVYAKKQLTWHKRDPDMIYLNFIDPLIRNTEKLIEIIKKRKIVSQHSAAGDLT